jgi:hypothetical protein
VHTFERAPLQLAPYQRVLVATVGVARHARIQIDAGSLAGSEINLALVGTRIEAQLLTSSEASRQTLVAAMELLRDRLRERGVIATLTGGSSSRDGDAETTPHRSSRAAPRERDRNR